MKVISNPLFLRRHFGIAFNILLHLAQCQLVHREGRIFACSFLPGIAAIVSNQAFSAFLTLDCP